MLELEDDVPAEPAFKEYPGSPWLVLPTPVSTETPLHEAIRGRLTCRSFARTSMALDQLSTILSMAYGVLGTTQLGSYEHLERPVPSGGGLYPLELYCIVRSVHSLEPGVYHYAALVGALEQIRPIELSDGFVSQLFMGQPYLAPASVILVMAAVVERTMQKYRDRGYRYMLLEAGHVAQNVCLVASSAGLGALPLGGFFDGPLAELLSIDLETEILLYALGLGCPSTTERAAMRNLAVLPSA